MHRRSLLTSAASLAATSCGLTRVSRDHARPRLPSGVQSGDPLGDRAVVWSRSDRDARMRVEWSLDPAFGSAVAVIDGPLVTSGSDFTGVVELTGLPLGAAVHYRVTFASERDERARSEPIAGRLFTAPVAGQSVRVAWSGDTCGQGFGIDRARGGMRTYESLSRAEPRLFLHSGDLIYADNPLPETVALADGSTWRNLVTPAKAQVAQSLDDFRGNFAYNLLDDHVRRLAAEVPMVAQWDDHEVHNNWSPGRVYRDDPRYTTEPRADVLAARARRAFAEYVPMRRGPGGDPPIHRVIPYGPRLDLFLLDERSFRSANGFNREPDGAPFLGPAQLAWLKRALTASRSTWKVIATDMPLGLQIPDGERDGQTVFEGLANGDGPPLGRELELASLLTFLHERSLANVVFVTADVHYAAAHHYDPARARFGPFLPFWEFVAGPLHAGTFGPAPLDPTFGPEVRFQRTPAPGQANLPPSAGMQSFGLLDVDAASGRLTVRLLDGAGATLFAVELEPRPV